MEFKKGTLQAWKVMENDCGHGKSWKRHGILPMEFFNRRIIILSSKCTIGNPFHCSKFDVSLRVDKI